MTDTVKTTGRAAGRAARQAGARGFSLLELMLVLVIIGLLSAVAAVAVVQQAAAARVRTTKASLNTIQSAISQYEMDKGALPGDILILWTNQPAYLQENKGEVDPWGTPFYYRLAEAGSQPRYDLRSAGPDRELGTEDDITVWDVEQQNGA